MSNSYTSIKINTANAAVNSKVGIKIPTTLGFLNKGETYTIQFKYIHLSGSENWDIIIRNKKVGTIVTSDFENINLDENITAKLCYITFIADEEMIKPSVEISRVMTKSDTLNTDICEITDIALNKGGISAYSPNVGDFLYLKSYLNSKIKVLSEGILFSASKKDVDILNDKISEALAQISVQSGKISLSVQKDDVKSIIEQSPDSVMIGFNEISDVVKINKDGMTLRGILEVLTSSGTYARLEPIERNGEIQFRMTLSGMGIDSNFNVIDGTGKELFRVGHGGVELNNNVTFKTDQTGDYNGNCYWENGTYYPANDWKNIIGRNSNAFYKIFSYKFGLDRTGVERYADFEGPILRFISSWGYGGLVADNQGYFFPEQTNAWSLGKTDKRISTIYCTNLNQPSDLQLKENVRYLLRNEAQVIPYSIQENNLVADITTHDLYDFVKNDLKLAEFNYKLNSNKEEEKVDSIGFIAQDIQNTKVGNKLITSDTSGVLSYDSATYTGILAGALQKAIEKIEELELKILNVKRQVESTKIRGI